jgi:hypothetical protein
VNITSLCVDGNSCYDKHCKFSIFTFKDIFDKQERDSSITDEILRYSNTTRRKVNNRTCACAF